MLWNRWIQNWLNIDFAWEVCNISLNQSLTNKNCYKVSDMGRIISDIVSSCGCLGYNTYYLEVMCFIHLETQSQCLIIIPFLMNNYIGMGALAKEEVEFVHFILEPVIFLRFYWEI